MINLSRLTVDVIDFKKYGVVPGSRTKHNNKPTSNLEQIGLFTGDEGSTAPQEEVEDLVIQLCELVNEKNDLFRKQTELMYM